MAIYDATVTRSKVGNNVQFDVVITYGGVRLKTFRDGAAADLTTPEERVTLIPQVAKANRQFTSTLDQYDHDETHLYAKVTVLFDGSPAWLLELFAQPDPDPPHVWWVSKTRIDPTAPVAIDDTGF